MDLTPARRQAIVWTNAELFSITSSGTIFSEIRIKMQHFSFKKMNLNVLENGGAFVSTTIC